jgi:hypothetical protein
MVDIKRWATEKLLTPARLLTSVQIGLAVAVGFWAGIFPIPALSTFATLGMCTVVMRRAFSPAMTSLAIAINLIVTPIQLLAMPVFMNLPSKILTLPSCSVGDLLTSIKSQPILETCSKFGLCMVWAVLSWSLLTPLSIFVIRTIVSRIVRASKND